MKKFASVLLAVLVAFSMFSFVVSAANAKLTVTADKTNVNVGDTVTVTVTLAEKSGLGTLTVKANYDSSVLKATDMKTGTLGATVNVKTGIATMAAATTFEDAGTVCVMTFEAVKAGNATVTFDVTEATDADFANAKVDVAPATITVAEKAEEPSTEKPSEEPSTEKPSEEPSTDATEPTEHEHTWSTWATEKTPTCKDTGVKARNCTVCGEKETEAIDTVECSKKWEVTKKATATEYGEKVLKCVWCGKVYETQKLALADKEESLDSPAIPNTDAIA